MRGKRTNTCGKVSGEEMMKRLKARYPKMKINGFVEKYHNKHTRVSMFCKIHGEFELPVNQLLVATRKEACPECKLEKHRLRTSLGIDNFKEQIAKKIGVTYEAPYFDEEYRNYASTITLDCPEHGHFRTSLIKIHKTSKGCPKCEWRN